MLFRKPEGRENFRLEPSYRMAIRQEVFAQFLGGSIRVFSIGKLHSICLVPSHLA